MAVVGNTYCPLEAENTDTLASFPLVWLRVDAGVWDAGMSGVQCKWTRGCKRRTLMLRNGVKVQVFQVLVMDSKAEMRVRGG